MPKANRKAKTIREQIEPLVRSYGVRRAARAAEIDPSALSNWLAGRRRLSDAQIERLAAVLGATITVEPNTTG